MCQQQQHPPQKKTEKERGREKSRAFRACNGYSDQII